MSQSSRAYGQTDHVVEGLQASGPNNPKERLSQASKRLFAALCAIIALTLWITPVSYADDDDSDTDTDDTSDSSMTITSSITDTENLLGSDVTAVSDAIDETLEDTGVSVRLLYLSTFATDDDPEDWARDVLDSTDPDPNTVMLAVASYDGSLVVAVSSNSDDWLRDQDMVDELSQAALDPLIDNDTPDWSGSALAMMDAIDTAAQTATSRSTITMGILVMAGVVIILIVLIVIAVVLRKRSKASHARGGRRRTDGGKRSSKRGATDTSHSELANNPVYDDTSDRDMPKDAEVSDTEAAGTTAGTKDDAASTSDADVRETEISDMKNTDVPSIEISDTEVSDIETSAADSNVPDVETDTNAGAVAGADGGGTDTNEPSERNESEGRTQPRSRKRLFGRKSRGRHSA